MKDPILGRVDPVSAPVRPVGTVPAVGPALFPTPGWWVGSIPGIRHR